MGHMYMAVLNYDILLTKNCNGYEEDLFIIGRSVSSIFL